jgi:hypothetical protein
VICVVRVCVTHTSAASVNACLLLETKQVLIRALFVCLRLCSVIFDTQGGLLPKLLLLFPHRRGYIQIIFNVNLSGTKLGCR